jgi:hypothetical protein
MKKMNFGILPFISIIGLFLFNGCKKEIVEEPNPETFYAEYELFYNANTNKTAALAKFRLGGPYGNPIEIKDPAMVTFNDDTLLYNSTYNCLCIEYSGKVTSGTFVYKNSNNTVCTNSTPIMDSLKHPQNFATIHKSAPYTYAWIGNPLAANERVYLHFGSWNWMSASQYSVAGLGATSIILSTNQLNSIYSNVYTTYIERIKIEPVQEGANSGGEIRMRYMPQNVLVNVTP